MMRSTHRAPKKAAAVILGAVITLGALTGCGPGYRAGYYHYHRPVVVHKHYHYHS